MKGNKHTKYKPSTLRASFRQGNGEFGVSIFVCFFDFIGIARE